MREASRAAERTGARLVHGWALCCAVLLAIAVLVVYGQVHRHGFVEYDDPGYVSDNPIVRRGLTVEGVRWAFTTGLLGNWNPVSWLSHMLDVQLFGLNAGAHHLVSVALHLLNTMLLFAVLARMTRAVWPSLAVAALFALHPLHVESVAWISERKDVLSTCFWFLTIAAYARYAERHARRWYVATVVALALGLMVKPMLVTLPFVLLLLDFWPLGRLVLPHVIRHRQPPRRPPAATDALPLARLVWEKTPLFLIIVVASAVAYVVQLHAGAIPAAGKLPLAPRVANALVAYVRYLGMAIWPADLAVLYPFEGNLPLWQPVAAALVLAAISLLVLRVTWRHPYLLVGWLWYLGTLVPVIGFVQIGNQALADRYTYVPLIGVFIMAAWSGRDLVARLAIPLPIAGAAAIAVLATYAVATWAQVARWRDGETLLTHTVRVTRRNPIAHNNLGVALGAQGKNEAALEQFEAALRIKPDYADAYTNVGLLLWRQGRREEAAAQYRLSLRYAPDSAETHSNLGLVLTELGQRDEAIMHLREAIRLDPLFAGAYNNLGNALRDSGRRDEAIAQYEAALRVRPDYADPYNNIGAILAAEGRHEEAAAQFRAALERNPQSAEAHYNLALALFKTGEVQPAIEQFRRALERTPDDAQTHNDLGVALVQSGQLDEAIGHFQRALQLKPDLPDAQYNLEVARTMAATASGAAYKSAPTRD